MKTELVKAFKSNVSTLGFALKKHSPEIMIVAGAIGTVAAAVLACKASMKVPGMIEEIHEELEEIHFDHEMNGEYTEKEYKKELTRVYVNTGLEFAKLYGPAIALGTLSMGTVFASNHILRKRNASLAAAYATVDGAFRRYRTNVVDQYGAEVDHALRHNIRKEKIEVTEIDENGKEKKVKKVVDVTDFDPTNYSDYAKFFDESCKEWEKDPEYNLTFLKCQQNYANDMLRSRGHLFLNEVYDMLGMPRTKAGNVVGWLFDDKNPIGDNYVDFGIYDLYKERNRDFVNGYERSILLDFNVDGDILNKI